MSVRYESQARVTTVILDSPDGRPGGAAEGTDLASREGPVGRHAGTGRHSTPVA